MCAGHSERLHDPFVERLSPPRQVGGAQDGAPLSGLRFACKANMDVVGLRTGNGSPDWRASHRPAFRQAECVSVLLRTGAALVGVAHMDELAFSIAGENAHYGALDNPRAPGHAVGGSSSGAAVAVACGEVDFALGTDTCGSVRVPASHCGVWGLRPTHGAIPLDGVCPLAPSFDTVGILARNGTTLMAASSVLLASPAGPPAAPPATTAVLLAEDAIRLYSYAEVGELDAEARARAESDAAAHFRTAAASLCTAPSSGGGPAPDALAVELGDAMLERAGPALARYVPTTLDGESGAAASREGQPAASDGLRALEALSRALFANEAADALGPWAAEFSDTCGRDPDLGEDVGARLRWAISQARVEEAGREAREAVASALDELLASAEAEAAGEAGGTRLGILCMPAACSPPPRPGVASGAQYRERAFALSALASLAGCPQLVVPVGTCEHTGLPLAVSFVARPGRDRELLQHCVSSFMAGPAPPDSPAGRAAAESAPPSS